MNAIFQTLFLKEVKFGSFFLHTSEKKKTMVFTKTMETLFLKTLLFKNNFDLSFGKFLSKNMGIPFPKKKKKKGFNLKLFIFQNPFFN